MIFISTDGILASIVTIVILAIRDLDSLFRGEVHISHTVSTTTPFMIHFSIRIGMGITVPLDITTTTITVAMVTGMDTMERHAKLTATDDMVREA